MEQPHLIAAAAAVGAAVGYFLVGRKSPGGVRRVQLGEAEVTRYTQADVTALFGIGSVGLLPATPVTTIADPYFAPWETLSARLPELLRQGKFASAVDILPELSAARLRSTPQLQRAYVLLGQLVHAWVHGHRVSWDSGLSEDSGIEENRTGVVPRQLSVPFHSVCVRLGMPCVLTAVGQDLWNWAMIDPTEGMTPANLRCLSTITGTRSEVGFHAVPCAMNFRLGKDGLLLDLINLPYTVSHGEMGVVASTLIRLADALRECIDIFGQIKHLVDADEWYNMYRPVLGGFAPDGVLFAGVGHGEGLLVMDKGPSAGQHVIFALIDYLLSVPHRQGSEIASFQAEMIGRYMPAAHRNLLYETHARVEAAGRTVRDAAMAAGGDTLVAYNASCDALRSLRARHLGIATRYLTRTSVGTGGSSFRVMLKEALDNTAAAAVSATSTPHE